MPETMSTAEAIIAYDGPAVDAGEMDVRELAPALLALGDLCQAAARELNGPEAQLRVKLRAQPEKGSFELLIGTDLSWTDTLISFINSGQYRNAKEILEAVGLVAGTTATIGGGLFWLIKKLRGEPIPPGVTVQGDGNHVHVGDVNINIPPDVLRLYQSPEVLAAADRVIEPLRRAGITAFEARDPRSKAAVIAVHQEDTDAFRVARVRALGPGLGEEDDAVAPSRRDVVLEIIKPAFHRGHRWMLTDGAAKYGVEMRDEEFWQRVDRGEAFAKGDRLTVSLWTRTRSVDGSLKAEYFVDHVLAHTPRPRQLSIFEQS